MIESTITWGNVVTLASVVIGFVSLFWRLTTYHAQNASRMTELETKMEAIWIWFTGRMERRKPSPQDYDG